MCFISNACKPNKILESKISPKHVIWNALFSMWLDNLYLNVVGHFLLKKKQCGNVNGLH